MRWSRVLAAEEPATPQRDANTPVSAALMPAEWTADAGPFAVR